MGILELIVGILLFLLIVNLITSLIPIPQGIGGAIIVILIIILVWRLVF